MNQSLIRNLLRSLLRWWWLIVLAVSVGLGAGYLLRSAQPDMYRASATLSIGDASSPIPVVLDFTVVDSFLAFVQRNSTLQPVIDDLQLGVSVEEFRQRLEVTYDSSASGRGVSPFITLSILDTDPERAAAIINRLSRELVNRSADRATMLDQEFLNAQAQDLQRQITQLQEEHSQLVEAAAGMTSALDIQNNLNARTETQETIQQLQVMLLQLLENAPQSSVFIEDAAEPNYFPVESSAVKDLAIAGAAGGLLAIVTIALFTFFDDRVQYAEGMDEIEGARALGPLGVVSRKNLPLFVDKTPQSVEAEALRQVRSRLSLLEEGRSPQVLTITSYDSGDGKTLTSVNLALLMAFSGLRTIIIDGDMRRGDLHEVFDVPNVNGLSALLTSDEAFETLLPQAVLQSGYDNLALIPCGHMPTDPAALLERPRFAKLIHMLRSQYEAIVLDGVPILGGPDSAFLANASDGVVVVVNNGRTRLSALQRTLEELRTTPNINIMGVVFNRVYLQVTSRYNNKYYRNTPLLNAEKLKRELDQPKKTAFPLTADVIVNEKGRRLFSIKAAATQLGVKPATVKDWVRKGQLKAERRALRQWVYEDSINSLMKARLAQISFVGKPVADNQAAASTPNEHSQNGHHMPEKLAEQRQAVLKYALKPSDKTNDTQESDTSQNPQ